MTTAFRIIRILARLIGYALIAILCLALLGVLFVGFTPIGSRIAADQIAKLVSTPDQTVTLGTPSGLLNGHLRLDSIVVSDTKGPFAEVRDLAVDWSPLALLSGTFKADQVSAGTVNVLRAPVVTQPSESSGSGGGLPVAIDIDRLQFPDVRLGRDLAGRDYALAATGALTADNDTIEAQLDVNRADLAQAGAKISFAFAPSDNRLVLDAKVHEPAGGLIAGLLRLPNQPAVDFDIAGKGPLSDWSGKLSAALDGRPVLSVTGRHQATTGGTRHIAVKGGGQFDSLMPPALRPLFAGETAIDFAGSLGADGRLSIENGMLSTGSLDLTASGTFDPAGANSLSARLTGRDGPVDFRWPMDGGEAKFLIENAVLGVQGPAGAARLDVNATLASADLPQGRLEDVGLQAHSDAFDLSAQAGRVDARLSVERTQFENPDLNRAVRGPIMLTAPLAFADDEIRFEPLSLESGSLGGTASGRFDMATQTLMAALKLFAVPGVLPPDVAEKFSGTIAAEANLTATIGGETQLNDLKVTSNVVEAEGSLSLSADQLVDAALKGRVPDIHAWMPNGHGAVTFDLTATGPLSSPAVKANLAAPDAQLAGQAVKDLSITADATANAEAPVATLSGSGSIGGQPIQIDAQLDGSGGALTVPTLKVAVGQNHIDGKLAFSPEFLPDGQLSFDLPDLSLLFALAGQQAEGDLAGSAVISNSEGRIQAALSASGSGIRTDAARLLKPEIDLKVSDVQALKAEGTIRAEAIEAGANHVENLRADITQRNDSTDFVVNAAYDGAPVNVQGNARITDGATAIGLDAFSAKPRGIAVELADPTTITIENGLVTLPAMTLKAGGGRVSLDGTVGEELALDIRLADLPATLAKPFVPDLTVEGALNASAALRGTAAAPRLSFDADMPLSVLELPQARLENLHLSAKAQSMDLSGPQGTIDTQITIDHGSFGNADLARALAGPLSLQGPVRLRDGAVDFGRLQLKGAQIEGAVQGAYDFAAKTVTANAELTAQPAALPAAAAGKFDGPVTVTAAIKSVIGGDTTISDIALKSGTVVANGNVSLTSESQVSATLKGRLPDLGKLLADARGQAEFTVNATGAVTAPNVKATLTADKAELAGRELKDLTLNADALADPAAPQATLKASGALGGQTIDVDASVATKDGQVALDRLLAVIGRNRVEGTLTFTPAFLPEGKLDFDLPDLGLVAALAGQKAAGDLKGSIDLAADNGRIRATVAASGSGIRQNDLRIVNPVIDVRVDDLASLAAEGTIKAQEIVAGANRVNNLVLTARQEQGRTDFNLKANYDGAPAVVAGNLRNQNGAWTIGLDQFSAAPRRVPLRLDAPTVIRFDNGNVQLKDLGIRAGKGLISVTGSSGSGLSFNVRIADLPADLANAFAPSLEAEGVISGTAAVSGTPSALDVDYKLTWNNAAIAQTKSAGVAAFNIRAEGRLANNVLRIDTTLSGAGGLGLSGGGTVGLTGNQPLSLSFKGTVPFSLAAARLSAQGLGLDGSANVDISIGGTVSAPTFNGSVTADGAKLVDVRRNIALNNLGLSVSFDQNAATISRLTGRLAQGGTISVTGRVGIAPGSNFPADLTVRLDKAAYVDGQIVSTVVDGNLTLTGPILSAPVLGGTLRLGKTAITVPEKLPASLAEINVKHKNAPADVRAQQQQIHRDEGGGNEGTQSSIGLNITIEAPSQIFVRGRGIDAELGGSLTVRGTASEPIVSGGFDMRRGRFVILNKRLDFTSGRIGFGGSLTPTLDLVATNVSGSTTVTVSVEGVANDPNISFSSSPALPQDEILAQLIFGQSMSKLSALQIAQLADAASQLAGGRSTSLFQSLRSKLGVDDLDISTDDKGEARVSAGKYLNSRTYIELQGGGQGGGKAIINLDVGRGVKLRGEAGGDGEGAAGIFYEKEY